MKFLSVFLQLLPTLVGAVEQIGSKLQGHQKKAAVQAGLVAIASGVAAVSPEHAQAAQTAAATATAAIDGVVQTLTEAGVLNQHKATGAVATAGGK
jgi:predicted deacylase